MLRELAVLLWALVPVLLAAEPASAAWAVNGSGPSRVLSVVMPQGAVPTVAKVTDPVLYGSYVPVFVLSWNTATLPGGHAVGGYQIRRTVFPCTSVARTEIVAGGPAWAAPSRACPTSSCRPSRARPRRRVPTRRPSPRAASHTR